MSAIEDSGLDPHRRARIERSVAGEPGLGRELELIAEALDGPTRIRFWNSLARLSAGGRSVTSVVLEALAEAARH
jgi:hypothetical protein